MTRTNLQRSAAWVFLLAGAAIAVAQPERPTLPDAGPAAVTRVDEPPATGADGAPEPFPLPQLAEAVTRLLDQDYLTDDEKRAVRLRHGVWEEGDLTDAAARAQASLVRGAFGDRSLEDLDASPVVRAQAFVRRGMPEQAVALLEGRTDLGSVRILAEALIDLGRAEEADAALETLAQRLTTETITNADELVEGVRGLLILARLRGPESKTVSAYRSMLAMLARARDELDRLSWNATLCEAQLLYEKDNYPESAQALEQTLMLNPRCAEAWYLLGQISVDGFDFPRAESIAARLDELAKPGVSAWAASIRAAVQLRENEGEAAEAALAPALAAFPAHRGLLALHAASAAGRFDFDAAQERLDAFDRLAPGSPAAYMAVGKAMASARQYEEAARFLRVAADRWPNWPEPIIELGLSELQAGRNGAALEALERAASLDSINVRAANSLTLLRELNGYASAESEHFVVRYKPGVDAVLAQEMLGPLEAIHARVTGHEAGGIDHSPAHKTVLELYPNHRWFGVRITGLPQLHTIAAATGPVIAMEAPREGPGHFGAYDWARVVQHEYTHTVTLSRTKNRLPHWFTEASAVYLEDRPRDYPTVKLLAGALANDALFDFDTINVMFVRPRRPTDRSQAYAQGAWMYEYIIETFGPRAPLALMDLYASGVRENAAFQQVLGVTRNEFLTRFKAWAHLQVQSWGMAPTEAHPDIAGLLGEDADEKGVTDAQVDAWLESHPDNPFVLSLAVGRLTGRGKPPPDADAVPMLERYAIARPVDPLPHKLLATIHLSSGTPERAIPHLEYLDVREQSSNGYAIELARRYAALNRMTEAFSKSERATQIAPYDAGTREFAATIAIRAGRLADAQRHIEALVVLEPDRPVHKERLEAIKKKRAAP